MSIQRWYIQNPPGQPTEFVSYADHVAALRACEARMRAEERAKWSDLAHDNWQSGWEEGLDAAREAVAALLRSWGRVTDPEAEDVILAAIDALKGES